MATYYVDLENGNDANNGTTFALRKKTIASITPSPGDTVRVMASSDQTTVGTVTRYTKPYIPSISIGIAGATNTTPITVTFNNANHGLVDGDTIFITGVSGNANTNGTWQLSNVTGSTAVLTGSIGNGAYTSGGSVYTLSQKTITLSDGSITYPIECHQNPQARTAWTASTNISTSLPTGTGKTTYHATQINFLTAFTTGKAAYKTLSSTNLSGYQQISFWIMATTTLLANDLQIKLCSDTLGATAVNTINIPAIPVANVWQKVTVDTGSALGSAIQSIALYSTRDFGAVTITLDNIIACKAPNQPDSLTLNSLINTGEEDHSIQSIVGNRILLAHGGTSIITTLVPQCTTSGTYTLYKKEPIIFPAQISTASVYTTSTSGNSGNLITYSGGWNRTDMSSQTSKTWISGCNSNGYGFQVNKDYVKFDNFGFSSFYYGIGNATSGTSSYCQLTNISYNNVNYGVYVNRCPGTIISMDNAIGSSFMYGQTSTSSAADPIIITNIEKMIEGFLSLGSEVIIQNINKFISSRFDIGGQSVIENIVESYHLSTLFNLLSASGTVKVKNLGSCYNITTFVANVGGLMPSYFNNGSITATNLSSGNYTNIYFNNVDFTITGSYTSSLTNNLLDTGIYYTNSSSGSGQYNALGNVSTELSIRHTASGNSWKMQPTSVWVGEYVPLKLKLGSVAFNANSEVTIKTWVRRDNTGLNLKLILPFQAIPGTTDDVSVLCTANADTWQELTITFTPTAAGVGEFFLYAYGGTTYTGYVDDVTITQA